MAAKYLHSLADENPDLQKQIGCMTGVFQVFNRHHMVPGRHLVGYSPKRGGSGGLIFNDGMPERESSVTSHMEQHRISTESSKDLFSSWSPSSPFSYMDCNTRPPEELRGSRQTNRQNLDLRDVVKDSMYREARGLSHKTTMKKEAPNYIAAKLPEANWYCDEPRELSRSKSCQYKDGIPFTISKDYPQFSFDGRESDHLSTAKTPPPKQMKELPRFSLDSKDRSIRTPNSVSVVPIFKPSDSKSNLPSGNPKIDGDKDLIQTRPPSVVAKLMGLEAFPDSESTINKELGLGPIKRDLMEGLNPLSKSSAASDDCGSARMKNSMREPTSPGWKNLDMKPISRVPIEAAPWKQQDARITTSSTKLHGPTSSVYGEVDKRVKNLEFSQSGKDLRALKQILEAMQAVESKKSTERSSDHEMSPSASKGSDVSRAHESHIVIMKPSKLAGKGSVNKTGKDSISESTHGERRSRPSMPLTDSNKPRKESNKKQSESRSSNGRRRPSNLQQVNGGRSLKTDTEVNASEHSEEIASRQSSSSSPEKSTLLVKVSELLTPEYPSPVSVLDDSVYMDDSPSPVKRTRNAQKDDGTQNPSEEIVKDRYEATNDVISKKSISGVSSLFNRDKLKKVADLVQKLKRLNSNYNEAQTDYIASLCDNTNPNDRYISEIFLASGLLLRDLESFEFHSSGHPINPELYRVLEHTKFKTLQKGKFHRKLIFDAVNEILMRKLSSASKMMQTPRKLLRELCLEIEQLQVPKSIMCNLGDEVDYLKSILWEDVLQKSENWTDFHDESPGIAGEVERLIFRDLVNEVVWNEACDGKLGKLGICCK